MDEWKFYGITHENHSILNPISSTKLDHLVDVINLKENSNVLDIACGTGELLVRLVEKYNISGLGIDLSPYHFKKAVENFRNRIPNSKVKLLQMDGKDFKLQKEEKFDATILIGASWIYGGYKKTLEYLSNLTKEDGLIVIGEPYWISKPTKEYLKAIDERKETFSTHLGNVQIGEKLELSLVYSIVSDKNDWDVYEGLQWITASEYVQNNPNDPDNEDLLKQVHKNKIAYFTCGRDALGFAIYVFKKNINE